MDCDQIIEAQCGGDPLCPMANVIRFGARNLLFCLPHRKAGPSLGSG